MKPCLFITFCLSLNLWAAVPNSLLGDEPGARKLASIDPLETSFRAPPAEAKPHTWWHWMNGNVTKDGITADLEAMKRVGIGGAQAFHVSDHIPAGPVTHMSPAWLEMTRHAVSEADRLGLEICLHNCGGWSASGGPWIKPEYAMQKIVFTEKRIKGPVTFSGKLPQPKANKNFYRDIAVLAFPTPAGEIRGKDFRIPNWMVKSGLASESDPKRQGVSAAGTKKAVPGDVISLDAITDLTARETWDVPAGDWTIVRFGYTPIGTVNRPAPVGGLGLECDKFSSAAARLHWSESMGKVIEAVGPLAGRSFNNVLIDSYEVGMQNWTPEMAAQFRKSRGYELLPYLLCVTGRVVGNIDRSERFLWDFRRTLADLFVSEYVGTFKELCRKNGLLLSIEPYGLGNFNHLEIGALADIPMGEFWVDTPMRYGWTGKLAASVANANGRKFVGAESFTAAHGSAWNGYPASLKSEGDHFFCQGINRFIFHTFVHQPWKNVLPGMTMGPHGMQGNRNNTWFEQSAAWMTYLARCQYLLQEGRSVMDLAYMISEDSPVGNNLPARDKLSPVPPKGYDYDVVAGRTVMEMSVKDGRLVLPGGMTYRVLVLTGNQQMRPALARKINELVNTGAIVVGPRPLRSPSLENYPACDEEVKRLGEAIPDQTLGEALAKIRLGPDAQFKGGNLSGIEYLHRRTESADIYFVSNQQDKQGTVECSFRVADREPELWDAVTGNRRALPEYKQENGLTTIPMKFDACQSFFVVFRAEGALEKAVSSAALPETSAGGTSRNFPELKTVQEITGPWTVKFPSGWGAPEQIQLDNLISWTKYGHPDVKHFSGTATYVKDFKLEKLPISDSRFSNVSTNSEPLTSQSAVINHQSRIYLDLGRVEVMAEVWLNGRNLGVVWTVPYQVDVTTALRSGENHLEIRVVNQWINRLIGDSALPADAKYEEKGPNGMGIKEIPEWLQKGEPRPVGARRTFCTWEPYAAGAPLVESGLLGPVTLVGDIK